MAIKKMKAYHFGDMCIQYVIEEEKQIVGLWLLPEGMETVDLTTKRMSVDSMVQLKLIGDIYPTSYAQGSTMRNSESTGKLHYHDQIYKEDHDYHEIITELCDERGYTCQHVLKWHKDAPSIEITTTFINKSQVACSLEMLSSFSLGGMTPFTTGDAHDTLLVHRIKTKWSQEGRLDTRTIEDLLLEPSWGYFPSNSERFGQVGSMPVKNYFPFVGLEDKKNQVLWGAMLGHMSSWQMEIYRRDDALNISGGIADREFGHWTKTIQPGESFTTPTAILTVCRGSKIENITDRLNQAAEKHVNAGPEIEQTLPIVFNEYCTTWGSPSHENITSILEAIKDKGFEYFVVDCGWFKDGDTPWNLSMGDYDVSKEMFPEGLEKTVEAIRNAGMKPGIWFEIENVGPLSKAYHLEDHLLKRDGHVLTTQTRRFWDMNDPWVIEYLEEKIIGNLKHYGFEYMKIDYNDTIGIGCDGSDSLGEGLRRNMEGTLRFIERIKSALPGIVIENCASGGHRLEPVMMGMCSMASFSDAHECTEIPIIAADLHRMILPRQSQIWAVIRKEDSLKRIAYSVANTFLGRMCLSGDVRELDQNQWLVIDKGIHFYKRIAPIIKEGYTQRFGDKITSSRNPEGWQGVLRTGSNGDAFVVIHTFGGPLEETIQIELPKNYVIDEVYSECEPQVTINGKLLMVRPTEQMQAIAVYLK